MMGQTYINFESMYLYVSHDRLSGFPTVPGVKVPVDVPVLQRKGCGGREEFNIYLGKIHVISFYAKKKFKKNIFICILEMSKYN